MSKLVEEIEALPQHRRTGEGWCSAPLLDRYDVLAIIRKHEAQGENGDAETALRYIFQVGYNVAHADCTMKRPYNGDAGKEYAIFETREPEAGILRRLCNPQQAPQVNAEALESMMDAAINEARRRERLPTMQRWELEAALSAMQFANDTNAASKSPQEMDETLAINKMLSAARLVGSEANRRNMKAAYRALKAHYHILPKQSSEG